MPPSVMAAIQALGKIGGIKAKEYLEHCLNSPSEVTHQVAKQALKRGRDEGRRTFFST